MWRVDDQELMLIRSALTMGGGGVHHRGNCEMCVHTICWCVYGVPNLYQYLSTNNYRTSNTYFQRIWVQLSNYITALYWIDKIKCMFAKLRNLEKP